MRINTKEQESPKVKKSVPAIMMNPGAGIMSMSSYMLRSKNIDNYKWRSIDHINGITCSGTAKPTKEIQC